MRAAAAAALVLALGLPCGAARGQDTLFPAGRSLPRDLVRGAEVLAGDAWAALTFPARLGAGDRTLVLGAIGVGAALLCCDEPLHDAAVRGRDREPFATLHRTGGDLDTFGLMGKTWPWYTGAMALGYALDQPRLLRIGGEVLEAQLLCGGLRSFARLAVGRRRPNEGYGAYRFELDGGTSLPSGHASSVFALVEVLSHHAGRRWLTVGLYGLGAAVMYQRTSSSQHWPSDAWLGAAAGFGAARLVTRRHDRQLGLPAREGLAVSPVLLPLGQAGMAVGRHF